MGSPGRGLTRPLVQGPGSRFALSLFPLLPFFSLCPSLPLFLLGEVLFQNIKKGRGTAQCKALGSVPSSAATLKRPITS